MRTLKKTLCLVLCLAMMVGLCVVGASAATIADYSDKDAIEHEEAVAVLSAMGVLQGDDQGTFRPTATLTRAEGATIIMKLHATVSNGTSSFTDMGSAAWAQGAVAYCEGAGIIAGMGDGTFHPQDTLTVAQFAKMLIVTLGYDADMEGLVGNAWEINTAKMINKIDLAKDLGDYDINAAVTRDQASQMALNALQADVVEYVGGTHVKTGDGNAVATTIRNTSFDYQNRAGATSCQLIEQYFPTFKLTTNEADDYSMPVNRWYKGANRTDVNLTKDKRLAEAPSGNVMKVYTTDVGRLNKGTLYTDGKFTATGALNVIENGDATPYVMGGISKGSTALLANSTGGFGFAGASLYLVDTDNNGVADTLIVKYPFLANVTKVIAATNTADRKLTATVYKNGGTQSFTFACDEYAVGDWLLIYPAGDIATNKANIPANTEVYDAVKAEVVTGNLAKKGLAGTIVTTLTIGDVLYGAGAGDLQGSVDNALVLGRGVTGYLANGYVLHAVGTNAVASDYVYILAAATPSTNLETGTQTVSFGYLKQDGTTATAKALQNPTYAFPTNATGWATLIPAGDFFFVAPAPTTGSGITQDNAKVLLGSELKASKPTVATGITANDNTVMLIKSGVAPVPTVYTGIKSVPTFTAVPVANATVHALLFKGFAAAIYLDFSGLNPTNAASGAVYVLNGGAAVASESIGGKTYYSYNVLQPGKDSVQTVKSTLNGITGGLVEPTFDKDGYLTNAAVPAAGAPYSLSAYAVNKDVTVAAGVLKAAGNAYALDDGNEALIYNTTTRTMTYGNASDLVDRTGTLWLIAASKTNAKIKTAIFIE